MRQEIYYGKPSDKLKNKLGVAIMLYLHSNTIISNIERME